MKNNLEHNFFPSKQIKIALFPHPQNCWQTLTPAKHKAHRREFFSENLIVNK